MTYERFDEFEAYIDNTLPLEQRGILEQQLADDATLRADLDEYSRFRFSLESIALNQQLTQIHSQLNREGALDNRHQLVRSKRRLRLAPLLAAVVLLFVLGLGVYWAMRPTPAEKTFLAYYEPEPRERGVACDPELKAGLEQYRVGNYDTALIAFQKLSDRQTCVHYYRGLTQLALSNAPAAVTELEQALARQTVSKDYLTQKNEWYLALAYLKANRADDAHRQLQAIVRQSNHPFRQDAQRALATYDHAR